MGEIADLIAELWPRAHAGHPGLDLTRGECVDCPVERERIEWQRQKDEWAAEMSGDRTSMVRKP